MVATEGQAYTLLDDSTDIIRGVVLIKLQPKRNQQNTAEVIAYAEDLWEKFNPSQPFEYSFIKESIDKSYKSENTLNKLISYFSIVAIVLSCLDLFGLSSFTILRRSKEIAIRKVMGATVSGVTMMLSKEFMILVIAANIIAWPVAFYFMNQWLQNFAYRIDITLFAFVAGTIFAFLIASLTIAYQSIKTAMANPVDGLRSE